MSINKSNNQTKELKKEVLARIIKAYLQCDFEESIRLIPYDMRPKGCDVPYRCCVYKERAIIKDRVIAGLGISIENDDEKTLLSEYAKKALDRKKPDKDNLTVIEAACKGCVPNRVFVTNLCQGCVARPCVQSCKFGAITIAEGKSQIDGTKCKGCMQCIKVCPYNAIVKVRVPCEDACPVEAIAKDENGNARIDFSKCITCGKCVTACPFGAVNEKSQIIDILQEMKQGKKVIAMVAPAIMGQFSGTPQQLHAAIKKLGFYKVYEVAQGADITTKNEAKDFTQRMEEGAEFMTTSCCAGYIQLVKKHLVEMQSFVSHTQTPLFYTSEIVKNENPDCISVFFSPCTAKRKEVQENPLIDYVISFEELSAWFVATKINVEKAQNFNFDKEASKEGREYAITGGVAKAVEALVEEDLIIKAHHINGLNKQTINELKKYAKTGECEFGNLIEVMACEGGCIAGNGTINPLKTALKKICAYGDSSKNIKDIP